MWIVANVHRPPEAPPGGVAYSFPYHLNGKALSILWGVVGAFQILSIIFVLMTVRRMSLVVFTAVLLIGMWSVLITWHWKFAEREDDAKKHQPELIWLAMSSLVLAAAYAFILGGITPIGVFLFAPVFGATVLALVATNGI